ncbi:MAG: hypothetical protein LBV43_05315 [Prevotella sp.]|jgi:hypothetical protein|nr:hypothetical protein [Prevotella sp.]
MKHLFSLFIITTIYLFAACTPYNSNEANIRMIQGTWLLQDVEHSVLDTVTVDYNEERTYLIFKGSDCIQYMPDLQDTLKFTFAIRDYKLILFRDSLILNTLHIDTLTNESLILSHEKSERVYKRIQE